MTIRNNLKAAFIVSAALTSQSIKADIIGSLTLIEPTGTVQQSEGFDIWARFSLAPSSDDLNVNRLAVFPWGITSVDIPTSGLNRITRETLPFDSYTSLSFGQSKQCRSGAEYICNRDYYDSSVINSSWLTQGRSGGVSITAGESIDLKLFEYMPNTIVPEGTYVINSLSISLKALGLDADGNTISADIYRFETCEDASLGCTFQRTVVADVSEPGLLTLFAMGLLLLTRRFTTHKQS